MRPSRSHPGAPPGTVEPAPAWLTRSGKAVQGMTPDAIRQRLTPK